METGLALDARIAIFISLIEFEQMSFRTPHISYHCSLTLSVGATVGTSEVKDEMT